MGSQILPLDSAKFQSKLREFPIFQSFKFKVWILQPYWGPKAPTGARRAPSPPQELEGWAFYRQRDRLLRPLEPQMKSDRCRFTDVYNASCMKTIGPLNPTFH